MGGARRMKNGKWDEFIDVGLTSLNLFQTFNYVISPGFTQMRC